MIDKQKFINDFSAVIHDLANQIMVISILQSKKKDYSISFAEFKVFKKKCFSLLGLLAKEIIIADLEPYGQIVKNNCLEFEAAVKQNDRDKMEFWSNKIINSLTKCLKMLETNLGVKAIMEKGIHSSENITLRKSL